MRPRDLIALGVGQCVNWGVLYYAFAVLLLPVEAELRAPRWAVIGAFSLSLLISAWLAPSAGRLADRGRAPRTMFAGGLAGAALLLLWATFPSLPMLYLAWAGLGACMAGTLYEPAFAIVGRRYTRAAERLRALAVVTLIGGLASTAFLPLTNALVRTVGWRWAVIALAVLLAVSTWLTRSADDEPAAAPPREWPTPIHSSAPAVAPGLTLLQVVFGVASLCGTAVTANLVPAVVERQLSPTTAAFLGATFGVLQLPGRALMLRESFAVSPLKLLAISLALQSAGLITWGGGPGKASVVAGLTLFAIGAGLNTLVRPYLVQTALAGYPSGAANGQLARVQHLSRAAGPVLLALLAHRAPYGLLLVVAGGAFAVLAVVALRRHEAPSLGALTSQQCD